MSAPAVGLAASVGVGTRIVEAPWVLPIASPPIEGGAVLVDERGTVLAVGPRRAVLAQAPSGTPRLFAGDVVIPALANAHLHLELSALRGRVPGGAGLPAWVRALLTVRGTLGPAEVAGGVARALEELAESGTGVLGDVASGLPGGDLPLSGRAKGMSPSGPEGLPAAFEGVRFHEALSARPEDAARALGDARDRMARDRGPLRAALAAHAPATCSEDLLALVARESKDNPVSLHLAEDPAERALLEKAEGAWADLLRDRGLPVPLARGLSPVELARRAGLLGPRTLAVHCVDLTDADVAVLAASGATAVLCPRSNRFLGLPAAPVEKLLRAKVPLALGTDSLASSPSLNVLEEAAALAVAPEVALAAATRGGALALGLAHRGTIAPGQRPGLVGLDLAVGRRRPEAAILEQPRARAVWV